MLRKFKYIIPIALAAVVVTSCKKGTFDINVDPNNPSSLPVNNLLPNIEGSIAGEQTIGGLGGSLEVYMHRITVREEPNAYGITGSGGIPSGIWNDYYQTVFTNADLIVAQATPVNNLKYAGIAKIIKAYAVSQLVDVFGDVPYSEAGKLITDGIRNPKFDDDATIYPKLLALIDEGIGNLNSAVVNPLSPGADDVIYQGSVTKWVKAANSLKLKLYTQERKVTNVTAQVTALLANPANLIASTAENFQVNYSAVNKNPGYFDYGAAQRTQDISPWLYEVMKGISNNTPKPINIGNPDPRIPYYFFNQIPVGQTAVNDNNATEYRDGSFVSIYFGSNGPDVGRTQQNTMTLLGIYPVGGKYDDGTGISGGKITNASGTGAAPGRMITYADVLFLQAELINTGVITGDARAVTLAAITEAFKQVDAVAALAKGSVAPPVLSGTTPATSYINGVMAEYDAASTDKKLQIIMTQKWISTFGSGIDPYTDYRRTGYPVLFDPNNAVMAPGGKVQPPVNGNPLVTPQNPVPVSLNRAFPVSLPWPTEELTGNQNAPASQKDPGTYKVFWQP